LGVAKASLKFKLDRSGFNRQRGHGGGRLGGGLSWARMSEGYLPSCGGVLYTKFALFTCVYHI
jgi:hypothetical protein